MGDIVWANQVNTLNYLFGFLTKGDPAEWKAIKKCRCGAYQLILKPKPDGGWRICKCGTLFLSYAPTLLCMALSLIVLWIIFTISLSRISRLQRSHPCTWYYDCQCGRLGAYLCKMHASRRRTSTQAGCAVQTWNGTSWHIPAVWRMRWRMRRHDERVLCDYKRRWQRRESWKSSTGEWMMVWQSD